MAETDIPMAAFRCNYGLFKYIWMPFHLKNAPMGFQLVMVKVLSGVIWQCVVVYLDDIVVYLASTEE